MRPHELKKLFDVMARNGAGLTPWERNFINSVYSGWEGQRRNTLSPRQKNTLAKIHLKTAHLAAPPETSLMPKIIELRGTHWHKLDSSERLLVHDLLAIHRRNPDSTVPPEQAKALRTLWDQVVSTKEVA